MSAFNLPLRRLDEDQLDNPSYVFDNNGSLTLLVSLAETGGKLVILSPETVLARRDEVIRAVNAHDRLIEALEALVGEIENSDTEWGISSSLLVGAYLTRDQLAEARAALALARGEVE